MDAFLQHLISLRNHMNENEDKMNVLTAKQHEQRTVIHALQEDLKRVRQESKRLEHEIEHHSKEREEIFNSIQRSQKSLVPHEAESRGLAEALQILKEEIIKQSSFLVEKELYFNEIERTTRSALETCETKQKSRSFSEGTSNEETKADLQSVQLAAYSDMDTEDLTSFADLQRHLKYLTDQRQHAGETLKDLNSRYHEIEIINKTLEEKLLHLRTEKTEEEEFKGSLAERLTQLKELNQQVTCESCGHEYTIQYKDSDFTVWESSAGKFDDFRKLTPNVGSYLEDFPRSSGHSAENVI